jgi:CPA1 family monovalent cation:H+ antiporter
MLEGEGLLNDATALVVLRTAIASVAATISLGRIVTDFLWLFAGGILCGILIAALGIWLRRLIHQPELTTALTFVIPFAAFLADEAIGASGEVAVVITGLATGWAGVRFLEPQDRQYGRYNWLTIATMLEGALFFLMGLELSSVLSQTRADETLTHRVELLLAISGIIALTVRAIFVFPLLAILNRASAKSAQQRHRLEQRLPTALRQFGGFRATANKAGRANTAALRQIADADYRRNQHLGVKEGLVILWAGMRGAVTLAAALTLPRDFPSRSLLVLLASVFATGTLLIQGFTLPFLLKRLSLVNNHRYEPTHFRALRAILRDASSELLSSPDLVTASGVPYADEVLTEERENLHHDPSLLFIDDAAEAGQALNPEPAPAYTSAHTQGTRHRQGKRHRKSGKSPAGADWSRLRQFLELRRRVFQHQHDTLLEVRKLGIHDSEAVSRMFDTLDAEQMAVELRLATIDAAE